MELFGSLQERIEFLRKNPIFWSLFGHESESGNWDVHMQNAQRHRALFDKGILVHSSVVPSGWVAPDTYDYEELDRLLEMLFSVAPDILFLPRVKLNVPDGWCEKYPQEVYVYEGGPRTLEEIQAKIGTEVHGSHPCKPTDLLALQSLSSKQWQSDAAEAMGRFVTHLENSKWKDHIIGYHVAYGTCGESTQWGSWNKNPLHHGDYGIGHTKAFLEYAAAQGKIYQDVPPIRERFFIGDAPVENNKCHIGTPALEELFLHTPEDERCVVYSRFQMDINCDAIETICKAVKQIAPEKVTGIFYGYIVEPDNCGNGQHAGFDRILNSPWVDFLAGPKGYTRVSPLDPGLGQAVPNSVNRKKLWVDELDNRTHLSTWSGSKDHPAKNFQQTRAVYWREFTKNVAFHQGYWWMDLGGGWLDSDEIRSEMQLLNDTNQLLQQEKGEGVSQVLLVMDEECLHHTRPNFSFHRDVVHHTGSVVKECGVPVDFYRLKDLPEMDLSGYKMIVFLNAFRMEVLEDILEKTAPDCHILWNYAPGILGEPFGLEGTEKLTGFRLTEYMEAECYPVLAIEPKGEQTVLERFEDGRARLAQTKKAGRTYILDAMPRDMTPETMQQLLKAAGVHIYAPAKCVVHADNRFLYVLAEKKMQVPIRLRQKAACKNVFTGERFSAEDEIVLDMEEGTCAFLKFQNGEEML